MRQLAGKRRRSQIHTKLSVGLKRRLRAPTQRDTATSTTATTNRQTWATLVTGATPLRVPSLSPPRLLDQDRAKLNPSQVINMSQLLLFFRLARLSPPIALLRFHSTKKVHSSLKRIRSSSFEEDFKLQPCHVQVEVDFKLPIIDF